MKFSEKLSILRRDAQLSQEALAEHCGVSRQAVSKWEAGRAFPSLGQLISMAQLFSVPLDVLCRDDHALGAQSQPHCGQNALAAPQSARFSGVLIKESLQDDGVIAQLLVYKMELWDAGGQPRYWTALYFTTHAPDLPQKLAAALRPDGWFCDFADDSHKYIVLRDRVFSYERGNVSQRAHVVAQLEALGIPRAQTHWED